MLTLLKQLLKLKGKEIFDTYKLPNGSVIYVPKGEKPVSTAKAVIIERK